MKGSVYEWKMRYAQVTAIKIISKIIPQTRFSQRGQTLVERHSGKRSYLGDNLVEVGARIDISESKGRKAKFPDT